MNANLGYSMWVAYDLVGPYDCSPPRRGGSTGATENAGFNAKVQRNHGLDFVKKQHKSLQKNQPVYSCWLPYFRCGAPLLWRADTSPYTTLSSQFRLGLYQTITRQWPSTKTTLAQGRPVYIILTNKMWNKRFLRQNQISRQYYADCLLERSKSRSESNRFDSLCESIRFVMRIDSNRFGL